MRLVFSDLRPIGKILLSSVSALRDHDTQPYKLPIELLSWLYLNV
jgi:hypothetical protein